MLVDVWKRKSRWYSIQLYNSAKIHIPTIKIQYSILLYLTKTTRKLFLRKNWFMNGQEWYLNLVAFFHSFLDFHFSVLSVICWNSCTQKSRSHKLPSTYILKSLKGSFTNYVDLFLDFFDPFKNYVNKLMWEVLITSGNSIVLCL